MYVSIRRYRNVKWNDELTRKVEQGFAPILRQSPGFKGYHALDAGGGVVASISVFETEQQVADANAKAAEWVKTNLADVITEPPEITAGEALLSFSA